MKNLITLDEAANLITEGHRLLIAGDENLISELPRGHWIAGSIPYFMTEDGGGKDLEKLHVTLLPDIIEEIEIKAYDVNTIATLPKDYKSNGVSFIILPAFSEIHHYFARHCSTWAGIFDRPLVGWVSGKELEDLSSRCPVVMNGMTGEKFSSRALVLHAQLKEEKFAKVNIVNLFRQGTGDSITFKGTDFLMEDCFVNGVKRNFSEYIREKHIDVQLPLVASYLGSNINVAIQELSDKTVRFYAPVFEDVEYKFAEPIGNYELTFCTELPKLQKTPIFTCNCILNYLYAKLEGKAVGNFSGPFTFGEIAYMLINQTFVYLTIEDKEQA